MASSSSSSARRVRRVPVSFLGGPFLVDMLHQLPVSLVQLVFSFPSSCPTLHHADLVTDGLATLVSYTTDTLNDSLPSWTQDNIRLVRERALRHSALRQLALDWALDERARDVSPSYDPDTDKPEILVLALAGAIRRHLGERDTRAWLKVVMQDIISAAAERVAISLGNPSASPTNLNSSGLNPSPLQQSQPFFQLAPHPLPPPPPPVPPPMPSGPPTTYTLVTDAVHSLSPQELDRVFTHPSVNPGSCFIQYAEAGRNFLRRAVHRVLDIHADTPLSLAQKDAVADATLAPKAVRDLALSWSLDVPARHRGAPEEFFLVAGEMLFYSLVSGLRATHVDDASEAWAMQVMGEYVRQAFEAFNQAQPDQGPCLPPSSRAGDEALTDALSNLSPSVYEASLVESTALAEQVQAHLGRSASMLAKEMFRGIPYQTVKSLVESATTEKMLTERAKEVKLHLHPCLAGRVDLDRLGTALLAVLQAAWNENAVVTAARERVRLILGPIFLRMQEDARILGSPQREAANSSTEATPARPLPARPPPPEQAPLPPIFTPPSAGSQALQKLVSWLTPPTTSAVFTHPSVDPAVNYEVVLSTLPPATAGRKHSTSFLYVTITALVETWFDLILDKGQRNQLVSRVLGAAHLSRMAKELGCPSRVQAQPPRFADDPAVGRDVLVALVQGAIKDVSRETVAKWIETTFRPYVDQLKQYAPPQGGKRALDQAEGRKDGRGGGSGGSSDRGSSARKRPRGGGGSGRGRGQSG